MLEERSAVVSPSGRVSRKVWTAVRHACCAWWWPRHHLTLPRGQAPWPGTALGPWLRWCLRAAPAMERLHLGIGPRDPVPEFLIHRGLIGGDEAHIDVRRR